MIKNYLEYLDFSDVLIEPRFSKVQSRSDVNLDVQYNLAGDTLGIDFYGVPLIAANMDTIGTFKVASVLSTFRILTCLHKRYTKIDFEKNDYDSNYIVLSTGIKPEDLENLKEILTYNPYFRYICVDIANGYTIRIKEVIENLRRWYPTKIIIAGNIATYEGVCYLKECGAEIIKVGIGSGSVCTTRHMTGVGVPQLSAVIYCAKNKDIIISDGGCTNPGDVAKAFVAGAKFVMLGGMLAGHEETSVDLYGMSSETAMNKYMGGVADYKAAEGKHVSVPIRGKLKDTIQTILGGLRSTCAYTNCSNLRELIGNESINLLKVHRQANEIFV